MRFEEWISGVELRSGMPARGPAASPTRDGGSRTGDEPSGPDDPAAVRQGLERAAAELCARVEAAGANPLGDFVLSKRALIGFGQCEASALASLRGPAPGIAGWPVLRGRALDALVTHQIICGAPDDAARVVVEVLHARGDHDSADQIAAVLDEPRRGELQALAGSVGELVMDPAWVPRVEVSMSVELAAGAVRLPGRVDLLLGGPGTSRPAVVVEVKSGRPSPAAHTAELHHYALLCLLRHRSPPAATALWYADGTTVDVHVPGAAAAAGRRVIDVLEVLGDVWLGAQPLRRPGPHCRWCVAAASCPDGGSARGDARSDRLGEYNAPPAGDGADPDEEIDWDPEAELW